MTASNYPKESSMSQTRKVTGVFSEPLTVDVDAATRDATTMYVFSHGETVWHVPADDLDAACRDARANAETA